MFKFCCGCGGDWGRILVFFLGVFCCVLMVFIVVILGWYKKIVRLVGCKSNKYVLLLGIWWLLGSCWRCCGI